MSDEELKLVVGDDLESDAYTYYHSIYSCPICGKQHEFTTKNSPIYGWNCVVDKSTACADTFYIGMETFNLGNPDGLLNLRSEKYSKDYQVSYHFDYIMAGGVKHTFTL